MRAVLWWLMVLVVAGCASDAPESVSTQLPTPAAAATTVIEPEATQVAVAELTPSATPVALEPDAVPTAEALNDSEPAPTVTVAPTPTPTPTPGAEGDAPDGDTNASRSEAGDDSGERDETAPEDEPEQAVDDDDSDGDPEADAADPDDGQPNFNITLEPSNYDGPVRAIRTRSGLVLAVRGASADGFDVVTPCYNVATVRNGRQITGPLDILIDPGHGGEESGAVGPNGLIEANVNLRVAELTRDLLLDLGYTVELTRYGDHLVSIPARTELANTLAPRVFMSIHHNGGFPEPFPVAGTEVFVQLGDPESARLGALVFQEVQRAFGDVDIDWMGSLDTFGVATRANERGNDLYGVLRRTPDLVSVLTEAMFISTEAEAELLARPETLETEALALSNALDRFFTTTDPGTGLIEGIVFDGDLGTGGSTLDCVDPELG